MRSSPRRLALGLAAVLAFALIPANADAQVPLQPEPAPLPQPVIPFSPQPGMSYYLPPPPFLRPTQYSFNGPSSGTLTYISSTTTFYQPGPTGNRLATTTMYTPVFGYTPGYYRDYYTPLFFRP